MSGEEDEIELRPDHRVHLALLGAWILMNIYMLPGAMFLSWVVVVSFIKIRNDGGERLLGRRD